jgi:hypothetical protein
MIKDQLVIDEEGRAHDPLGSLFQQPSIRKDFDVRADVFPDRPITRDELLKIEHSFLEAAKAHKPGFLAEDPFPLEHSFAEGIYVREIRVPAGCLITTELFKQSHATFLLSGEVSMMTEEGRKRVKAPAQWITKAGVKRLIFTHSDVVWTTVHANPTEERDLERLRAKIVASSYEELEADIIEILDYKKEAPCHS